MERLLTLGKVTQLVGNSVMFFFRYICLQYATAQAFSVFPLFMLCYIPLHLNKQRPFTNFPGIHTLEFSYTAGEMIIDISTLENIMV